MFKGLHSQRGFTLTELIVSISIISTIGLVLSTLIFTGMTYSSRGSAELYVGNDMNKDLSIIMDDYRNSTTHNISNLGITNGNFLIYVPPATLPLSKNQQVDTPVQYTYDSVKKTLTRNGRPIFQNLESISVKTRSDRPTLEKLEIKLIFNYNGDKISVPTVYVTKRLK